MKKRLRIGIGVLIVGSILWWFGFFTRYNYLTAQFDIFKNNPRLISCEFNALKPGRHRIILNRKYGIYKTNEGCFANQVERNGIKFYTIEIEKYLKKRNGKHWRRNYQNELDSLTKTKRIE
jgi:hypothetical protein